MDDAQSAQFHLNIEYEVRFSDRGPRSPMADRERNYRHYYERSRKLSAPTDGVPVPFSGCVDCCNRDELFQTQMITLHRWIASEGKHPTSARPARNQVPEPVSSGSGRGTFGTQSRRMHRGCRPMKTVGSTGALMSPTSAEDRRIGTAGWNMRSRAETNRRRSQRLRLPRRLAALVPAGARPGGPPRLPLPPPLRVLGGQPPTNSTIHKHLITRKACGSSG